MFKKLLKNLTDNLPDIAKDMLDGKMDNAAHQDQRQGYMDGDMQKAFEVGVASVGMKTSNTAVEDPNDPNMQAVHGIGIYDYAAGSAKIGEGCSYEQICTALGVERPMWDEAYTIWNNRMRDDSSFNVINIYTNYFAKAKEHEKLGELRPDHTSVGLGSVPEGKAAENLARLDSDKYYFFEIQGAMEAAYANGMDGAQWLVDNLGLTVSQVNSTGTKYMNDFNVIAQMMNFQEEKKREYSERFAKQNGVSGVADDIEF